ncbi:ADP-ribosylation factor-like protein 2-binding protein [Trachypithecus francoisi]|uniref:ADP-ribosylation factor-like protein 2-binding protein n=1 Tax=Trachypithecus francoisi TaxID=54180 RepID=UPI00141B63FB|nr:ADP-ribosylation factor-like protein 2-binding protein [Trachypithecus francoisi]
MNTLEEENFLLSFSSISGEQFYAVAGYYIMLDNELQLLQRNFLEKYRQEFEDTLKNKLTYMPTFSEYSSLVEKYIKDQLLGQMLGFNMAAFTTLQHHKDEVVGDIFDILVTFTGLIAFKERFLDYKEENQGWDWA